MMVFHDIPIPVRILSQCRKAFYPIARIQIMNTIIIGISRMMDMTTNHSVTFTYTCKLHQHFLKVRYIGNSRLYFLFDGL